MESFLKLLGEAGYSGEPTVEAISSWLAANPNVTVTAGWEELFKAADPTTTDEAKSIDASGLIQKARADRLQKEVETLKRKAAFGTVNRAGINDAPAGDMTHKAARQAYAERRKSGKARFDDPEHAEYIGASLRLAIKGGKDYPQRANDLAIVGKTYTTGVNVNGGFTVPENVASTVVYMTEAYGTSRKIANEKAMTALVEKFPRKTAIGAMYAMSETSSFTDVQPTFDQVQLLAKDAGAQFQYSRNFLQDSALNVADDIATSTAEAYGRRIDLDYFSGDGTSTYNGHVGLKNLTTNTGGVLTDVAGTGAWSAFTLANFHSLMGTPINCDQSRLKFVCSRQFFHQVMLRLGYGTAKGSVDAAVASMRSVGGSDAEFLGYPVFFDQVALPIASANGARACYFGDFEGASMIGIRADLELMESEHTSAANRKIDVFAFGRYAINLHGHGRTSETTGMIAALTASA